MNKHKQKTTPGDLVLSCQRAAVAYRRGVLADTLALLSPDGGVLLVSFSPLHADSALGAARLARAARSKGGVHVGLRRGGHVVVATRLPSGQRAAVLLADASPTSAPEEADPVIVELTEAFRAGKRSARKVGK